MLPRLCGKYNRILLVSDSNTYTACAKNVSEILGDKIAYNAVLKPNGSVVIPNEEKIAEIEEKIDGSTDLIIGVGSGVINDLCKYVSFIHGLGGNDESVYKSDFGFITVDDYREFGQRVKHLL